MTELHFVGPDGPLSRFPGPAELRRVGSNSDPCHLDAFIAEAWQATNRVWVLDLHFLEYGYQGLLLALAGAMVRDVRIVSARVDDKTARLAAIRAALDSAWNQGRPKTQVRPVPTRVQWLDRLTRKPPTYPYPHDRFVVLDDSLWHFGFSAFGSANCLSAASGPWPADDTDAIAFFEELCEGLNRAW